MTTERVIARLRAGLKLIYPDDITPMGKRILDRILDEEVDMLTVTLDVAYTIGDLAGLPVGSRIATNDNKLLELDEFTAGGPTYWIIPGTLEPYYQALVDWLPVVILPPVVDHKSDSVDAGAVPPK